MKKKLYILLISVLGLSIQSCSDYLDSDYILEIGKPSKKFLRTEIKQKPG